MSTADTFIPETGLEITSEMSGVVAEFYRSMFEQLDAISRKTAKDDLDYSRGRYIISNYLYLIIERLQHNVTREIDYDQVKSWASKNRKLASYLLSKEEGFPMAAFDKWITPEVDLINTGMYSPSNMFTKNIYH